MKDFESEMDDWAEIWQQKKNPRFVKVPDFFEEMDLIIKDRNISRILRHIKTIQEFDIWEYAAAMGPERFIRVKQLARKKDLLLNITIAWYHYLLIGYLDPLMEIDRKKPITYEAIRFYYHKYTGPKDGPRTRKVRYDRARREMDRALTFEEEMDIASYYFNIGVEFYGETKRDDEDQTFLAEWDS